MSATHGVADHITVRQLADLLDGLSLDQVRGLVDRGTIHSVSFGPNTKRFVPRAELDRLRALGFSVQDARGMQEQQDSQPDLETENMNP